MARHAVCRYLINQACMYVCIYLHIHICIIYMCIYRTPPQRMSLQKERLYVCIYVYTYIYIRCVIYMH
jgi:hypothetical protein